MGARVSRATTTSAAALPQVSPSPWSDLPPELAGLVLRRLPSEADRVRFGAVCRPWRGAAEQSAPLPPALPWLDLLDGHDYVFQSLPDGEVHRLRANKPEGQRHLVCYGSRDNWLLMSRFQYWYASDTLGCFGCPHLADEDRYFLANPVSGATIRLAGEYRHRRHPGEDDNCYSTAFLEKIMVCSPDLIVANTRHGRLACCRPGMSSWSLCPPENDEGNSTYKDIAFHRGNIYAVDREGDLYEHKVSEDSRTGDPVLSSAKLLTEGSDYDYDLSKFALKRFLVVSGDKLLMVRMTYGYDISVSEDATEVSETCHSMEFKVFEADLEIPRWSEVASLGDQVLFVSKYCSKAVAASTHDAYLSRNRIYFLNYGPRKWRFGLSGSDATTSYGMYDLTDNTYHPIPFNVLLKEKSIMTWFFPRK